MNAIDQYLEAKTRLERFNEWAALIGREYFGGTCGKGGEFGRVVNAAGSLTIYHQERDGSNNYHELDRWFAPHLGLAMQQFSGQLIAHMRTQLEIEVERARQAAVTLAQELTTPL